MRVHLTVILVFCAFTSCGCFTTAGFGVGWRLDRVHNTRTLEPTRLEDVPAGERIRIKYDGTVYRGVLITADSTEISFRPEGGAEMIARIANLQSARYDRRSKSRRIIGGLIGLGLDIAGLVIIGNDLAFFPDESF